MATTNRLTIQARGLQVLSGIHKRLQGITTLIVSGTTYPLADFIALIQSQIDSANNVVTLKAKWRDSVLADHDLNKKMVSILIGFRDYVRNMFGNAKEPLADFGYLPRAATKPKTSSAQKAQTALKVVATRKARHTMGKRQKALVKGVVSTPAPEAPASPPAPLGASISVVATHGAPPESPSTGSSSHTQ